MKLANDKIKKVSTSIFEWHHKHKKNVALCHQVDGRVHGQRYSILLNCYAAQWPLTRNFQELTVPCLIPTLGRGEAS